MRRILVVCLTLVMVLAVSVKVNAKEKVSVFVEGNLTGLQQQIVNNSFMSRLSGSKTYTVFERNDSFLNAVTREQDYQVGGEVSESQIRKVAAKYGVDYVIAVNVMKDENSYYMSARLINIESGKVEKTVSQDRDSIDNKTLKNLSNNVAYRLISDKSK